MWAEYGWLVWVLLGGGFLFLMFRRGGCCGAGHGGHGGQGSHGGHGPAAMKGSRATRRQPKKNGLRPMGVAISRQRGRNGRKRSTATRRGTGP